VSKPRRKDKIERYLFERPSVPPKRRKKDVPIQGVIRMILKKLKKLERVRKKKKKPTQKVVDLLLKKWKKRAKGRSENEGASKAFLTINNFSLAYSVANKIIPITD
jgi:hypothetical protein